jgi:hypothetical protein
MPRRFSICEITKRKMSAPKKPNPPTPVESRNPMSPRKSPEPEDPPELPLLRELELDRELDELLPLDREPLLKDWPPPGRASKKVTLVDVGARCPIAAACAGAAIARAADRAAAKNAPGR